MPPNGADDGAPLVGLFQLMTPARMFAQKRSYSAGSPAYAAIEITVPTMSGATAVRSAPKWSVPVGSVISLHRFEVETLSPRSR